MANEIEVEYGLDGKSFAKAAKEIENSVNGLSKSIESSFKNSNKSIETFKGTLAGLAAFKIGEKIIDGFAKIGETISSSISIASEKETELAKLENALVRAGLGGKKAAQDFSDFADEIEKTTKFTDESALSAITLLTNLTKLDNDGIKRATKASVELASVLGIDLDSATRIMIKATEGNVTALNRQGIAIEQGKTKAETYANTLKAIEKFQGAAQAEANSYGFSINQLSKTFENLLESMGNIVIKNPTIIGFIKAITGELDSLDGSVKSNTESFSKLLTGTLNFGAAFGVAVLDSIDLIVRGIRGIGTVIISILVSPLTLASKAFVAFAENVAGAISFVDAESGKKLQSFADKFKTFNDAVTKSLSWKEAFTDPSFVGKASDNLDKIASKSNEFYIAESAKSNANKLKRGSDEEEATTKILEERKRLQTEIAAIQQNIEAERQFGIASQVAIDPAAEAEAVLAREQAKADAELSVQIQKNDEIANEDNRALANKKAYLDAELKAQQNFNKYNETITKESRAKELKDKQTFYDSAISLSTAKNKEIAAIGKAFAIQNAIMQGYEAVQASYRFGTLTGGPFLGAAFAAIAATATAANVAKIAGVAFEKGGIVPGNSYTGDNIAARVNSREMVLTTEQQKELFDIAQGKKESGNGIDVNSIIAAISSTPIVVQVSGREIARVVRDEKNNGFVF